MTEPRQDVYGRDAEEAPAVGDPETGEIRLLEDRCGHCILNPAATALPLKPGRIQQFTRDARDASAHVICHSTYPPIAPRGTAAAMCRGYVDAYGLPKAAQELIDLGLGHIVEVPDPAKTTRDGNGEQRTTEGWVSV